MSGRELTRGGVSGSGKGGLSSLGGGPPDKQMNRTRLQQSFCHQRSVRAGYLRRDAAQVNFR